MSEDRTRQLYADLHQRLRANTPDGFLPPDRPHATLDHGRTKPFEYRCMICGTWHVYPTPCPQAGRNEEAGE